MISWFTWSNASGCCYFSPWRPKIPCRDTSSVVRRPRKNTHLALLWSPLATSPSSLKQNKQEGRAQCDTDSKMLANKSLPIITMIAQANQPERKTHTCRRSQREGFHHVPDRLNATVCNDRNTETTGVLCHLIHGGALRPPARHHW